MQDAHRRVRKIVAKGQRHPPGVAKSEFPQDNFNRESVRNSNFVPVIGTHTLFCGRKLMREERLQFSYDKLIHSADFNQHIQKYNIEVDLLEVRRFFMACKPIKALMLYFDGKDVQDGMVQIKHNHFVLSDISLTCDVFQDYSNYQILSGMAYLITCCSEEEQLFKHEEMNYHFIQNTCVGMVRHIMMQNFRSMTRNEYRGRPNIWFTKGFGPGYYGMELKEGKSIHKLIKGERIGVTYQGEMMHPLKSTIGVAFSYAAEEAVRSNPCNYCNAANRDCMFCDDFRSGF